MTVVFSATWQSLRLGLEAYQSGRAAFSTLRATLSTSRQCTQPLQHFHNLQRLSYCTHSISSSARNQRPKPILRPNISLAVKQLRWASLRKPVPKPEEEAREFEVHEDEIKKIFGNSMDIEKGAKVLMALQICRIEGTLDEKLEYPDAWIKRGLAYLRARLPMDEDAAVIARIDREIEKSLGAPQISVVSQFETLRRRNEQKELERRRREAEEEKELETKGSTVTKGLQSRTTTAPDVAGRQKPAVAEWAQKHREKTEQMELPRNITTVQRLLPSGVLVVIVVTLSLLFAKYYKPPSHNARLFPELPPAAATILTIIAANVLVAFMWRIPPLWPLMYTTFAVTPMYPYAKTMLGASFSHQQPMHLFLNMFILWMLGTRLHDDIGRGPFLALYFASAVLGAYLPMVVYVLTNNLGTGTVGASVCGSAILAASCVLHEGRTIHLQGVPEFFTQGIDTGAFLAFNVFVELAALRRNGIRVPPTGTANAPVAKFDHMGHLTGFVVGIIAGIMVRLKDPKWKDVKREHWYTDIFTKDADEPREP